MLSLDELCGEDLGDAATTEQGVSLSQAEQTLDFLGGGDLPAFCGPFQASRMALSGLVVDSLCLNSAGVRFPRLECGRVSLK